MRSCSTTEKWPAQSLRLESGEVIRVSVDGSRSNAEESDSAGRRQHGAKGKLTKVLVQRDQKSFLSRCALWQGAEEDRAEPFQARRQIWRRGWKG
jgi:hypothetical protein